MYKIIVFTACLACVIAAPTPYDAPSKSGVVQEISKYHVTAQNKDSPAVVETRPTPINPAVLSDPIPKKDSKVTPLSESEEEKLRKTRENPTESTIGKDKKIEGPTTVAAPTVVATNKPAVITHEHIKRSAVEEKSESTEEKKTDNTKPQVNVKPISTTTTSAQDLPASTAATPVRLSPTAVHSSFSHTWTRPQPQVQAAVQTVSVDVKEDKTAAASESKPVLASIDPLKHVYERTSTTTTTTTTTSTTTTSPPPTSGHRYRRGVDESEAQDAPTTPKGTTAWWRSLDLDKKTTKAPVASPTVVKEDKKTPAEAVKEKRETKEKEEVEKTTPSAPVKQSRPQVEALPSEADNKPPQFVRPVPVAQILGKDAEIPAVHKVVKTDSAEEEEKKDKSEESHKVEQKH